MDLLPAQEPEHLTNREWSQVALLMHRESEDLDRWQGTADSEEYQALLRYLALRP
jgi:hypothetical protein